MIVVWYKGIDQIVYRHWDIQHKGTFGLEVRESQDAEPILSYKAKSRAELEAQVEQLAGELLEEGYVHLGHWDAPSRLSQLLTQRIERYRQH